MNIDAMKQQIVVKHTHWDDEQGRTWEEFMDAGEIMHDTERFDEAFSDPQDGEEFKIVGNMIVVPYNTYDDSLHGEVVATENLILMKRIEYEQSAANIYSKDNPNLPAYFLYLQAEEGPILFEV